jgi:hypothetical protein
MRGSVLTETRLVHVRSLDEQIGGDLVDAHPWLERAQPAPGKGHNPRIVACQSCRVLLRLDLRHMFSLGVAGPPESEAFSAPTQALAAERAAQDRLT